MECLLGGTFGFNTFYSFIVLKTDDILLFSAGRTGSTFIWQILKEIFPNVEKCHMKEMREKYIGYDWPCVITQRNPVDSYLSHVRCVPCRGNEEKFLNRIKSKSLLCAGAYNYRVELDYVEYVKQKYKGPILLLEYEKFFKNHDYVFEMIEAFFSVSIENKEKIVEKTSIKKNKERQKKFKNFNESDKKTGIHGQHVYLGYEGYSKDILKENYYELLKDYFDGKLD